MLYVGFPKIGSSTLADYLNCIGLPSNHHQERLTWKERMMVVPNTTNNSENAAAPQVQNPQFNQLVRHQLLNTLVGFMQLLGL